MILVPTQAYLSTLDQKLQKYAILGNIEKWTKQKRSFGDQISDFAIYGVWSPYGDGQLVSALLAEHMTPKYNTI